MRSIDDRALLIARLTDAGLPPEEVQRADAEGRAPTLAVELALGPPERHTITHVSRESVIGTPFLLQLMQAAGRPDPAPR